MVLKRSSLSNARLRLILHYVFSSRCDWRDECGGKWTTCDCTRRTQ